MNPLARYVKAEGIGAKANSVEFCDICVLGKQCRECFDGTREEAGRNNEFGRFQDYEKR